MNEKYIGKVAWFGDNLKSMNYGYIEAEELGEVYVNQDGLLAPIKKDDTVVFGIQKNNDGKCCAVKVLPLQKISDIESLANLFIRKSNYRKILLQRINYLPKDPAIFLQSGFRRSLEEHYAGKCKNISSNVDMGMAERIFQEINLLFNNQIRNTHMFFQQCTTPDLKLIGWLNNANLVPDSSTIIAIYNSGNPEIKEFVRRNVKDEALLSILEMELECETSIETIEELSNYLISVKEINHPKKEVFLKSLNKKCSTKLKYLIWAEEDSADLSAEIKYFIKNTFWIN